MGGVCMGIAGERGGERMHWSRSSCWTGGRAADGASQRLVLAGRCFGQQSIELVEDPSFGCSCGEKLKNLDDDRP
jgi:hypothetical protein